MRWSKATITTLTLSLSTAVAYQIDASCTQAGIEEVVRTAMGSAIEMAESANTRLAADEWDPYTKKLVGYLFAKNGQKLGAEQMSKARSVFNKIISFYKTEKKGDDLEVNDVIIYCDDKRYKKVSKFPKLWEDTVSGEIVQYDSRPCRGSFGDFIALAVTRNPGKDHRIGEVSGRRNLPTQVQLCDWFVDWVKRKEVKTTKDIALKTRFGGGVIKASESNFKFAFAEIDALNLLDKVLLHELTHGWMAYSWIWPPDTETSYGLSDLPSTGTISHIPFLKNLASYGWKLCRALAQNGEDVVGQSFAKFGAPDNNADTLALFGSACKMADGPNPRWVDEKGKISLVNPDSTNKGVTGSSRFRRWRF